MRDLHELDAYRVQLPGCPWGDGNAGAFRVGVPTATQKVLVIASRDYQGWDHVSASLSNRCPNWLEMCRIKDLFFHPHETAMQLHVPAEDHVNNHPYCLHLWRPCDGEIPRPPAAMVGIKGLSPADVAAMPVELRTALSREIFR